ncbi:MFS transporter [Nostoc sp. FACHB-110]|uniref:MFS transporter n=1 Tax=Nostoc sp. FACHB-110 TaxID=2692834 RepID=UPI001689DB3B|nr:MFS transporter [Nostoc sp. FACHB-110]MBD2435674.1 MFS transporter [Nostoc sp. FACHB-110]
MGKSPVSCKDKLPLWQPLTERNFLLLFIGETISLIGDQFFLVALPWLTIQLTHSPVNLGAVLMAAAVPRAILMLLGGVVSDRFSPRLMMLVSHILCAVLTSLLTMLVFFQTTQIWLIYLFAISYGIVEGFSIPAARSIIPTLVTPEQLIASNTLSQVTTQLIVLIGPALGGLLIATVGIEKAFAIDTASFVVAAVALLLIKGSRQKSSDELPANFEQSKLSFNSKILSLFTSIREGLNYTWHNPALRAVLLVITAINLFFVGPLEIGITSLAQSRFLSGAIALGTMKSAWGGGALLGTLMTGVLRHTPRLGILMLSLASIQGFGLFLLGFLPNILLASMTIAVLGCCSGFFTVLGITWIQKQTPPVMLGRVMSLGTLSAFGIAPFSYALAGLLADFNLILLFSVTGGIIVTLNGLLALNSSIRTIEY